MIDLNKLLDEALTIPEKNAGPVEKKLREKLQDKQFAARYPDFKYHDILVRCCRNDEKSGVGQNDAERIYISGLPNLMDMFDVYEKARAEYAKQKQTKKIQIERADGKTVDLDPVRDIGKIGRLEILRQFIDKTDAIVRSDTAIDTGFRKYAVTDEDRKNIRLIGWNDRVMVWGTKKFEPSQKFAVQLWQNIDTIDSAGEYGHPERQCPYCTHAKSHWDGHAGNDADYEQYWYLSIPDGARPAKAATLEDPEVVKIYNAMKGKGPQLLCAQNDSDGDWCDRNDLPLAELGIYIEDIKEEGEIEYEAPDPDDDDGDSWQTADVDFNGNLGDVQDLAKNLFAKFTPGMFPRQSWETDRGYANRQRRLEKHAKTLPADEARARDREFDLENDLWSDDIYLSPGHFENGRLNFRLPRHIKAGSTIWVSNAEIASFDGFPSSFENGMFNISFSKCGFPNGFASFPEVSSNTLFDVSFTNCSAKTFDILEHAASCPAEKSIKLDGCGSAVRITTNGKNVGKVRSVGVSDRNGFVLDMSGFACDEIGALDVRCPDEANGDIRLENASFDVRQIYACRKLLEGVFAGSSTKIRAKQAAMPYCAKWTGEKLRRVFAAFKNPVFQCPVEVGETAELEGLPPAPSLLSNIVYRKSDFETEAVFRAFMSGSGKYFGEHGFSSAAVPLTAALKSGFRKLGLSIANQTNYSRADFDRVAALTDGKTVEFYTDDGRKIDESKVFNQVRVTAETSGPEDAKLVSDIVNRHPDGIRELRIERDMALDGVDLPKTEVDVENSDVRLTNCRIRRLVFRSREDENRSVVLVSSTIEDGIMPYPSGGKLIAKDSTVTGERVVSEISHFKNVRLSGCRVREEPGLIYLETGALRMRCAQANFIRAESAENVRIELFDKSFDDVLRNVHYRQPSSSFRTETTGQTMYVEKAVQTFVTVAAYDGRPLDASVECRAEEFAVIPESSRMTCDFGQAFSIPKGLSAKTVRLVPPRRGPFTLRFDNTCGAEELVVDGRPPDTLAGMPWFEKLRFQNLDSVDNLSDEVKDQLGKYFARKSDFEYVPKREFFKNGRLKPDDVSESMTEWSRIMNKMR